MTDTIISTPIRQPPAFFGSAPGFSVAAALNFDCRQGTTAESNPKARFEAFLGALAKVTFGVYRLKFKPLPNPQPATPNPLPPMWPFEPTKWVATTDYVPSKATPAANILNWLERRGIDPKHPGDPAPHEYWQPASVTTATTLKLSDLTATHYLGSATAWPAPLPQDAGLVRVVTLTPTTDPPEKEELLVLVPFFEGGAPANFNPTNFSQSANGILNFTYDAGTDFPAALAEVRLIEDALQDVSSLVDTSNGFILAPDADDADRASAILERVENRSASLLWALPPIQSILWKDPTTELGASGRLVWRAMSGLAALLDQVVLSLTLPPPASSAPSTQKGPFVSALAVCVESQVDGTDTSGIADFIKQGLTKKLFVNDESNDQQRKDLVELIAGLFKIEIGAGKTGVLPLLLIAYRDQAPDRLTKLDWVTSAQVESLEKKLSNELGALAQKVQSEDGIETLVLNLFQAIGLFDKNGLASSPCTVPPIGEDDAKKAIATFRALLAQSFNGLDGARHAVSRLFELHLVAEASKQAGGRWTAETLEDALRAAHWFERRIEPSMQDIPQIKGTFDNIGTALPIYAAAALPADDREWLVGKDGAPSEGQLDAAFRTACGDILANGAARRFLPDHAPAKLRMQIAVDSDATHYENFVHSYNGIGVLVRRQGGDWAYGNLAELQLYQNYDVKDPQHPDRKLITILPLQPAAVDGQCRLFLEFDGHPFTNRSFAATSATGNAGDPGQASFYTYEDPPGDDLTSALFALTPALAYGKTYEAAAFVVGKGGALPRGMPAAPQIPWLPSSAPQIPASTLRKAYSRSFLYQRTTAIGRTSLNERPQPGLPKRIGVGIEGVQPLFRDHPRVGISSATGPAVLDILRNADGTGALGLPKAGETVSISLDDLWWWSKDASGGKLTLCFFNQPDPKPETAAGKGPGDDPLIDPIDIPVTASAANTGLLIEITGATDTAPNIKLTFSIKLGNNAPVTVAKSVSGTIESIWARLKIANGSAKAISLSFADPTANLGGTHVSSHPTADSLLLIAPNSSEWRAPHQQSVVADIMLPRVGFADLDRWLWNDKLFAEAAIPNRDHPPSGDELQKALDQLGAFRLTLMAAYIDRHTDNSIPPLLERLPDLAVDQLLVELTPLDALYDEPGKVTSSPPYATQSTTEGISIAVPVRTLGERLKHLPYPIGDQTRVVDNLLSLSGGCSTNLRVQSEDGIPLSVSYDSSSPDMDAAITVNVPRGMVARLVVRPTVPSRYLEGETGEPSIFDPRMATLATEIRDNHYIFDGASLVIESMVGALAGKSPDAWQDRIEKNGRCYNWENLVAKAVTVRPAGAHRSYDLVAQPAALAKMPAEKKPWCWRQLANMDVSTQRWRFTGRPIYSWLNPIGDLPSSNVAIEQRWDSGGGNRDKIIAFEKESFFDRDDADADSQTMRLNPSGETVLQSFPWEQPSATYFRHRLTIRSRYEGALMPTQVAVQPVWGADTGKDGKAPESDARSWIRVAMLADRSRLQLARPQLRALIPLTRAPETPDGAMAATPPIMAILDERPFAHGGLADRIATEIKTGLGYDLPSGEVLRIGDARKEFGPDPRLTYTPTPEDIARALTLRDEGPVGLTFDDDSIRSPVFANTAMILHPALMAKDKLGPGALEEHFLSVGLRRYLDPSWLMDGATSNHAIADSLWIGPVDAAFTLGADAMDVAPLIKLSSANGTWVVEFDPYQIDAGTPLPHPPPGGRYKILCTVDQGLAGQLAFLHSPLEKGRASLSVFALPSASTGDSAVLAGAGNQPLMMGGVEWQVAAGATGLKLGGDAPPVRLTSASPTTLMNWTRTGKDFDIWHTNDSSPINVAGVVAQRGGNACQFVHLTDQKVLTFVPERSRYPNPVHVHRHHAVIATGHAQGIGRPVEIFRQVFRSFGGPLPALKDSQAVRLVEFETPARPFAWLPSVSSSAPLSQYASVSFDLFSLRGDQQALQPGFSLYIRILGGDATNKTLTGWSVTVGIMKNDRSSLSANLTITNPKPAQLVRGLLLKVAKGSPISCLAIYQHGDTADAAVTPQTDFATGLGELLSVTLSSVGMTVAPASVTELWTDVSILTLPTKDDEDFTFEWFFTGGKEQSPADAVTETALLDLVEAQARIISVSPPIPIVDS